MFLHHCVTLVLYGASYLLNMTPGGAVIMYLHDWADIFTSIVRCFTETTILPMTLVGITGMATSWAWTRLIIFPQAIYASCFKYDIYKGAGFMSAHFIGFLLSILFLLHVHWFIIMCKSINKYITKGKAEDLQR